MKKLLSIALAALPIIACTTETVYKTVPPADTGEGPGDGAANTAAGTISAAEGGTLEADGLILEIPAGGLSEDTEITITKTEAQAPEQHAGVTPIYTFEPAGLKFKKAARVIYTKIPADTPMPVIGWGTKEEGVFEGLETKVADGAVSASIEKLTSTFVAQTECMKEDGDAVAEICRPTPAPADLKSGRTINGFVLTGFEYWQWKKPDPYAGGNEVAWGYNGDGQPKTGVVPTDASRACMAESFRTLEAILTNDPPEELKELSEKHGVRQFWFWNNDMIDAKASVKPSKQNSELWLFQGDRGDGGLIKWISSTERDGTCKLPTRNDLVLFAKNCIGKFPGCLSGK
ncbi:MAG: hypothetical protein KIS78_31615 [Labilithrix sp.]|nr:hypothetical protein [Labilithrix sp.]